MRGSGKTTDEELIRSAALEAQALKRFRYEGARRSLKPERRLNVAIKRLSTRSDGHWIKGKHKDGAAPICLD